MTQLVLSLFPGIGLLDMAFESEGFCVVRGPDLLWGGDIRRFRPPAGKFDGVIGGPPCNLWAATAAFGGNRGAGNLISEFERVIAEAAPEWFVMENVPKAPKPDVPGYGTKDALVRDVWCGGETLRRRRFSFGRRGLTARGAVRFEIEQVALHTTEPAHAVTSGGAQVMKNGQPYRDKQGKMRNYGAKTTWSFERGKVLQGLPADFDLPPFRVDAKVAAIGNGVPLPMGRAVAKAVKRALDIEVTA